MSEQSKLFTTPIVQPSPEEIEKAQSSEGGWTKWQLAEWGVPWPPPKGWRKRLIEQHNRAKIDSHPPRE